MNSKQKQRTALSIYFLLMGMGYSSYASRIATIKENLSLSEHDLGNLLMILPASAIIGIPLSGWLVSKYDSRYPLQGGFFLLLAALCCIGFSNSVLLLGLSFILFAVSIRVVNVAINTQSISVQNKFKNTIVGSFHALWSTGGIIGVLISIVMLKYKISTGIHLFSIALVSMSIILLIFHLLIKHDKETRGNKFKLGKPNKYIFLLGIITFFAAICEGGMYSWNGVYFKEVVKVEIFTYGYLAFMICMTVSRLSLDYLMNKISMQILYIACSLLIISGITITILVPEFWPAMVGFCLIGVGVAGLFPMTFILAGKAKIYSTGIVMSIIGTYSTVGAFVGPPIIGYLAENFGLQRAFIVFIIGGLMFIPLSKMVFNHIKERGL